MSLLAPVQRHALAPDVITYSAAISACEKGKQPQTAMSLLASMQRHGLTPNAIAYKAAISSCEKGQQTCKAMSLRFHLAGIPLPLDGWRFNQHRSFEVISDNTEVVDW